jgi:beta-lactamase class A
MQRRTLLKLASGGLMLPAAAIARSNDKAPNPASIEPLLDQFAALNKGNTTVTLDIRGPNRQQRLTRHGDQHLFVGSAVKTFILGRYLQEVEAGHLSEDARLQVGPEVWSPGGNVFDNVTGNLPARSVLEAMIAHSDNTATDMVIEAVGPSKIRETIAAAGLSKTLVPDSTRILFSYLNGAPNGQDAGWKGMQALMQGERFGQLRHPINTEQSMMSSADEMVHWYSHVLSGKLFKQQTTLNEFKRISAMADALPQILPPDIAGYGKGGSINWNNFYCFAMSGQMVIPDKHTVTFSFITNWEGEETTVEPVFRQFAAMAKAIIAKTA